MDVSRGLELRDAGLADARVLFEWANDPLVRAMAFASEPIGWERHRAWLDERLTDPGTRIYLALQHGRPAGQIRFDLRAGAEAEVDVHTAPGLRGRGLGTAIIALGVRRLLDHTRVDRIRAIVKTDNDASRRAFEKAGFREAGGTTLCGQDCVELIFTREHAG